MGKKSIWESLNRRVSNPVVMSRSSYELMKSDQQWIGAVLAKKAAANHIRLVARTMKRPATFNPRKFLEALADEVEFL